MSADGQVIVGYGYDPSGKQEAWIALRLSCGLVYELIKWALLIGVIALGFTGIAYLIMALT